MRLFLSFARRALRFAPTSVSGLRPVLALVLAAALLAAPGARAQSGDIYTVTGVEVDVRADSAAQARDQALAEGHRKAFGRLVARLVPQGAQAEAPDLSYDELGGLVRDFEVDDERSSAVRYLATLTFRFQPQAVRAALRRNEVPFAETQSKPVVVLPLFGAADDATLWDGPNPWMTAWSARNADGGLVPLEVPLGDLADIRAISAQAALNQSEDRLSRIAGRYGAEDVLITQAIPGGDPRDARSVQVITRRVTPGGGTQTWIDSIRRAEGEDAAALYARAAAQVAQQVENTWKLANVLRFESESGMTLAVPLDDLKHWAEVRRRLQTVPLIDSSQVRSLRRGQTTVDIVYFGDRRQLRRALAQSDLDLREAASDGAETAPDPAWTLHLAEDGVGN